MVAPSESLDCSEADMVEAQRGSVSLQQEAPATEIVRGLSLAKHLEGDDDNILSAILLPTGYRVREGEPLFDGVTLGPMLGSGAQARVFRLVLDDGTPTGKVVKVGHEGVGSKMLHNNVVFVGMDREWKYGVMLRAALQRSDGSLPGFVKVCDCVVTKDGEAEDGSSSGGGGGGSGSSSKARFSGMVMSELRGWEVYKRIDRPEFHNIHYVREMLFQVFSALDRAQRKLGFHHADLGMRNVMEHYPRVWSQVSGGEQARAAVARRPGYNCNLDGSRLPIGPDIEFKIIDFGLAKLSDKLAQAAGGRESQEVIARLQGMFGKNKRVIFASESRKSSIEMESRSAAGDKAGGGGGPFNWFMQLCQRERQKPRFNFRYACFGPSRVGRAAGSDGDEEYLNEDDDEDDEDEVVRPQRFAATPPLGPNAAACSQPGSPRSPCARRSMGSTSSGISSRSPLSPSSPGGKLGSLGSSPCCSPKAAGRFPGSPGSPKAAQQLRKPKKSPIESLYRRFWHRKGDVFHLLLGLALALDERVWPEEDEELVQSLISLVHHVTGIRMKASFAASSGSARGGSSFGKWACLSRPQVVGEPDAGSRAYNYGRWGKWMHWFKRHSIRTKAHVFPYNSGLLAGEALVHPFFGPGPRVQHAKLPAALDQIFPPKR